MFLSKITYRLGLDESIKNVIIFFPISLQASAILERHLVVDDRAYTMAELRSLGNNESVVLRTIRDALAISIREDDKRKYPFLFLQFIYFVSKFG